MVRFTGGLLLFTVVSLAAPPDSGRLTPGRTQQVLNPAPAIQPGNPRKLKGRFLQITDLHPDPFYKIGTDPDGEHPCHHGKGERRAAYFGTAASDCDSPFTLVNATFRWIKEHIRDEIDFVVWTGDSARHDNDEDIPRSNVQVESLNRFIVSKFVETFGKPDNVHDPDPTNDFVVPIVPTYGNNDILPHNIFQPGPNRWTKEYLELWSAFVPPAQRHSFARGGWFFSEVIPNRLAVISMNTLYFFESNSAVDGCDLKSGPGYEHFEWLRVQLEFLRQRHMKAILMGHVPPARTESKQSWDETCYQKYTLWQRQYRDVIIGNLFGHMNIDHFMFQDMRDLRYKFAIDSIGRHSSSTNYNPNPISNDEFHAMAKVDYLNELRDEWSALPQPPRGVHYASADDTDDDDGILSKKKKSRRERQRKKFFKAIGGKWGERFTLSIVSPSVVPNYFPTLRIVEYNISGLEHDHPARGSLIGSPATQDDIAPFLEVSNGNEADEEDEDIESVMQEVREKMTSTSGVEADKKKKKKGKKKKPKKPAFPVPKPPSSTAPPGPAYSSQTFTFLSWTQLYANLTQIHERMEAESQTDDIDIKPSLFEIENDPAWLAAARQRHASEQNLGGKHSDKHYKYFDYQVEYTTNNDKVYNMSDLTIRSWLDLAERIGRTELDEDNTIDEDESGADLTSFQDHIAQATTRGIESPATEVGVDRTSDQTDQQVKAQKKKKHPKGQKGQGKLKKNHLWRAFIKRAFVHTKADQDLEDDFD